jgi:two-component system sensor histidine kinase TctE
MRSLRGQLTVWLLGPLLALWLGNAWFSYRAAIESANRANDRSLLGSVLAIAERITVQDGAPTVDLPYSALEMFESNIQSRVYYRVRLGTGTHVTGYEDLPAPTVMPTPGVTQFFDANYRGDAVRVATLVKRLYDESIREPVVIQVAETTELRRQQASDTFVAAAIRELSVILLAVLLVWLAVRRGLRPLEEIRRQVRGPARSDLSPIDTSRIPLEVRPLVESLNEQARDVQRSLVAQRQFVSDAAHQFKTPLALLRTQADFANRQVDPLAARPALLAFGSHIAQLSHLVDQLLLLSRTEGAAKPEMKSVVLAEVARRATFDMLPVAMRRGIDLGFEGDSSAVILGNEFLLHEMLKNLIDNALRFTPTGGRVTVRVTTSDDAAGKLRLVVEDNGCGIPAHERTRVCDRFYQIPGRDASGSGLGLAIVREIASAHQAHITIGDGPDGRGTAIALEFVSTLYSAQALTAVTPTRSAKAALTVAAAFVLSWLALPAVAASATARDPNSATQVVKAGRREARLLIYSTAELATASPLLRDFSTLHPQIDVDYVVMSSGEAYRRFRSEQETGAPSADIVWSLAMDLQMKLVNDGYAQSYESPEASALPAWAQWLNEAFGTTYEPAALVFNRRNISMEEIPQSHREFARLLQEQPEKFRGKIAAYDVGKVGVGFLLATQDSKTLADYWKFACRFRSLNPQLLAGTGAMLERVASGEALIGYNLSGSSAIARARVDAAIGYVLLRDYTLVMSRIAFIAKRAAHPNAARLWIDYLLSKRGQQLMAEQSHLYAIRGDVTGNSSARSLELALGAHAKPVMIGPGLLTYLDNSKRAEFIRRWNDGDANCAATRQ